MILEMWYCPADELFLFDRFILVQLGLPPADDAACKSYVVEAIRFRGLRCLFSPTVEEMNDVRNASRSNNPWGAVTVRHRELQSV